MIALINLNVERYYYVFIIVFLFYVEADPEAVTTATSASETLEETTTGKKVSQNVFRNNYYANFWLINGSPRSYFYSQVR